MSCKYGATIFSCSYTHLHYESISFSVSVPSNENDSWIQPSKIIKYNIHADG